MIETLVFVSFDYACPKNKPLNKQLRTVAQYRWMNDDTFFLVGMSCELEDGHVCPENIICPLRSKMPITLSPEELARKDFYLCYSEHDEKQYDKQAICSGCMEQFVQQKQKVGV